MNSLTVEEWCGVLKHNYHNLQDVPSDMRTDELLDFVLKISGYAIQYMSAKERTQTRCLAAVRTTPDAIHHLNKKELTKDISILACHYCIDMINCFRDTGYRDKLVECLKRQI